MSRSIKLIVVLGILVVLLSIQTIWRMQKKRAQKAQGTTLRSSRDHWIYNKETIAPAPFPLAQFTEQSKKTENIRVSRGKNILICVLDAARADHFGCYGYPRATTPHIDRIAQESLVFERHYCQYPATILSTNSLFQSKYIIPEKKQQKPISMIEWLRHAGFDTVLFTASPNVSMMSDHKRGFELMIATYQFGPDSMKKIRLQQEVTIEDDFYKPERLLASITQWLNTSPKQPFFAYIHFEPPHVPFDAPEEMKQLFRGKKPPAYWRSSSAMPVTENTNSALERGLSAEETVNLYDANLRLADWTVGELENLLRKHGLFDETLFIITADHGEAFKEHGYNWHSQCPYDEALHIPLIMRFPATPRPVGRIHALTQTIDVIPTICDLFKAPYPAVAQGQSWLPMLAGRVAETHEHVFSAAGDCTPETGPAMYIIRDLKSTLILHRNGKTRALYDMVNDPHQTRNILSKQPQRAAKLIQAFRQFAMAQTDPPLFYIDPQAKWVLPKKEKPQQKREMSETLKKQLRTLGYLK